MGMSVAEFWEILELTRSEARGNIKRQDALLKKSLADRTPGDLRTWDRLMRKHRLRIESAELQEALSDADPDLGADDDFNDFACWLIAQGKDAYETVRRNPADVKRVLPKKRGAGAPYHYTLFGQVHELYLEKTGQELPAPVAAAPAAPEPPRPKFRASGRKLELQWTSAVPPMAPRAYVERLAAGGNHVVVMTGECKAHLFRATDGKKLRSWKAHNWCHLAPRIRISPDGRYLISLASPGDDYHVKVWRLPAAKLTTHLTGLGIWRGMVAVSDHLVMSGSRIYNLPTGELVRKLKGDLAFETDLSPDGRWAVHAEKKLCLWDTSTGELKARFRLKRPARQVDVRPDGKMAKTFASRPTYWDLETGKSVYDGDELWGATFAPDSKHAIVVWREHDFRIWDVTQFRLKKLVPFPAYDWCMTRDNHLVASSIDKRIGIWNIDSGKQIAHARSKEPVWYVTASNADAVFTYGPNGVSCYS